MPQTLVESIEDWVAFRKGLAVGVPYEENPKIYFWLKSGKIRGVRISNEDAASRAATQEEQGYEKSLFSQTEG